MKKRLNFIVNEQEHEIWISSHRSLLEVLRTNLRLTGTKHGCDLGDCGACTVLIEGNPTLSCIKLALQVDGMNIQTIESLKDDPVQNSFDRHVAAQCGYCTPGIVLSLVALRKSVDRITETEITQALGANICRCTGYTKIRSAAIEALCSVEQKNE